jgi:hypothetical protein
MSEDLQVTPDGDPIADTSSLAFSWHNDPHHAHLNVEVDTGKLAPDGITVVPDRKLQPPPLPSDQRLKHYKARKLHPNTFYMFLVQNSTTDHQHHGEMPVEAWTLPNSSNTFVSERNPNALQSQGGALESVASASNPAISQPDVGIFDLLVPQGSSITHYTHAAKTISEGPWQIADTLNLPAGSQVAVPAVSLIQSFLTPSQFEAFASIQPQQGSAFLVAFQFSPGSGPQKPLPVTSHDPIDQVSGTPALAQSDQGTFVLLVFRKGVLEHYTHPSNTVEGDWTLAHTLKPPADTQVVDIALTQSDGLGGFKTIVHVTTPKGDRLVGYEFTPSGSEGEDDGDDEHKHEDDGDNGHDSGGSWQGPFDLVTNDGQSIDHVTGSPALILSVIGDHQQFELLVPRDGVISYYTNSSGSIKSPWTFVQTLKQVDSDSTVAVSLTKARTQNLEAVARVSQPGNSDFMVSYEFNPATGWQGPFTLLGPDGKPIIAGIPFEIP